MFNLVAPAQVNNRIPTGSPPLVPLFPCPLVPFTVQTTKGSIYEDSAQQTFTIFFNFQRWELIEPLIRQQDLCLAISAFAPGSKVKLEPCNTKEARQVRAGVLTPVHSEREKVWRKVPGRLSSQS